MQMRHCLRNGLPWNEDIKIQQAESMYDKMYNMKFLPPGRGLWAMGTAITLEKELFSALNNCAFVSTDVPNVHGFIETFQFLMDSSMLGIGVGFDTKGKGKYQVYKPEANFISQLHVIDDTREAWVESLGLQLKTYLEPGHKEIQFDYSKIRKAGEPIKTFGGESPGPDPLIKLHQTIKQMFDTVTENKNSGEHVIGTREIVDIMNFIGQCVVAGGTRRAAEIAFGESEDKEFIDLKNYEKNPERVEYGWVSNNSIFATVGQNYNDIADRIAKNGEPGLAWLENMRNYGRMVDPPDYKDIKATGGNPCLEQTLESHEMCCLVETFPGNHDSLQEFNETLELAFLYAKSVTLGLPSQWP